MSERQKDVVKQAISLLREGMKSTGTGTLHYHKMQDAVKLLALLTKPATFAGHGTVLKDSYRTSKNFHLICQCGHENGRHWYYKMLNRVTEESGTVSWDCRDCECQRFQTGMGI